MGTYLRVCSGASVYGCGVVVTWCGSALVSAKLRSTGDGERLVHKILKKF